jgi:16S rRNA (guanine527-N7)-methyltransferase
MAPAVEFSDAQVEKLEHHYNLLLRWNSRINLTTVTELHEAAIRHYCESLFLATRITGDRIADVGSGPGFPGIPIAVLHPGWRVDLIESHQRKAVFLREATREMPNVAVIASRADAVRERYDWVVSRAVDSEGILRLRLAPRYALLIGMEDAAGINTTEVVQLPWGRNRAVAIVEVEDDASRHKGRR